MKWQTCIGKDERGEDGNGFGIITARDDGKPEDVIVDGGIPNEDTAEQIVAAHNAEQEGVTNGSSHT